MFKESHTSTEVVEIVNVLNAVPVTKAILAGGVDVVKIVPAGSCLGDCPAFGV